MPHEIIKLYDMRPPQRQQAVAEQLQEATQNTGCSAVRLAHLLWEQGVTGSNPVIPTTGGGQ